MLRPYPAGPRKFDPCDGQMVKGVRLRGSAFTRTMLKPWGQAREAHR